MDPVERIGTPRAGALVFTCEHASNRVPPPWRRSRADAALLLDHWGWDIGAAAVTRHLVARLGGAGVLSRYSRLLCDVNRAPDDPTLVLQRCDNALVSFNRRYDRAERVARFHTPFHAAVDAAMAAARPRFLVSIHSFTPVFRGHVRPMDAGVLYDAHDAAAARVVDAMRVEGFTCAHNEPYSGKDGLIYSAARHGVRHDVPYLELELRQDRVGTPARAVAVAERVARALTAAGVAG
jgi:predicted N-formylglutamate amidohydrolase